MNARQTTESYSNAITHQHIEQVQARLKFVYNERKKKLIRGKKGNKSAVATTSNRSKSQIIIVKNKHTHTRAAIDT